MVLVQCHEYNMAFSQQFYFLDKKPFGNGGLNYSFIPGALFSLSAALLRASGTARSG